VGLIKKVVVSATGENIGHIFSDPRQCLVLLKFLLVYSHIASLLLAVCYWQIFR
jgi:hypothetical protein